MVDDMVKRAMQKWPDVPDCYGWLGLDARGNWYLRDDAAQHAGTFAQGCADADKRVAKGSRLEHVQLQAFIERNYQADARGCWYFQNGPQRVYVELECAPWVLRLHQDRFQTHTHQLFDASSCWQDEDDRLYLSGPIGLGVVHTQDMWDMVQWLDEHDWCVQTAKKRQLLVQQGCVLSPWGMSLASPQTTDSPSETG
jgi:hypothetical protein